MQSRRERSIRHGDDRATSHEPGIVGRHCFSYGSHYDPLNIAFGPLVAANIFELAADARFERHEHAGIEIVTWVVRGELTHTDSTGRSELVREGMAARLSTGAGVWHSEGNSSSKPVTFVQLWLYPDPGIDPEFEVIDTGPAAAVGGLVAVATGRQNPEWATDSVVLTLRQAEPTIWAARAPGGAVLRLPAADGRWFLILDGGLERAGESLAQGDEVRESDAVVEEFTCGADGTEILLVTLDQA